MPVEGVEKVVGQSLLPNQVVQHGSWKQAVRVSAHSRSQPEAARRRPCPDLTILPGCTRDSAASGLVWHNHRAGATLGHRWDPEGGSPHRASFRPVSTLSIRGASTPGVSSRNISGRSLTCGHRGQLAHHSGSIKQPSHQAFCWISPQAGDSRMNLP